MRWQTSRRSQNVEDRRGMRISRGPMAAGGGIVLILVLISLLMGGDPLAVLEQVGVSAERLRSPPNPAYGHPKKKRWRTLSPRCWGRPRMSG